MTQPWLDDACSLADAVRRGDARATDALEASLAAIAKPDLNATVYLDAGGARAKTPASSPAASPATR
jgi:aspartyl-tRNA(Asn)/glutamyl-tRNA(Gln) amidotransferase subunit A